MNKITNAHSRVGIVSRGCWTAFRAGIYTTMDLSDSSPEIIPPDEGFEFALVNIKAQCTQYVNSSSLSSLSGEEISRYNSHEVPYYTYSYCHTVSEIVRWAKM